MTAKSNKSIPITNVKSDTPKRDTIVKVTQKPFLLIPVYTPNNVPETNAINAEIKTNSIVAGNLSIINLKLVFLLRKEIQIPLRSINYKS